jgi:hypothetical protein
MKGGKTLTVLFGTVEYFEKEIVNILKKRGFTSISMEQILDIISIIENEFRNEFVCAENVRIECLQNLMVANKSFMEKNSSFLTKVYN